ncbi:MAG: hypothetical protein IKB05_04910 [Alphaproteobacteria bacterium]|nr:hypothetical protein [Alphaproteobacteria bacterium]
MKGYIKCLIMCVALVPTPSVAVLFADGELCLNSGQCESGVCQRNDGTSLARCAPKAKLGEACSDFTLYSVYYVAPCDADLQCVNLTWTGEEGEAKNGICIRTGANFAVGDLCINNAQCESKSCVIQSETDKTGVCTALADENEPCDYIAMDPELYIKYPKCERGLSCRPIEEAEHMYSCVDLGGASSGTTAVVPTGTLPNGEPCLYSTQCTSGVCLNKGNTDAAYCAPRASVHGQQCSYETTSGIYIDRPICASNLRCVRPTNSTATYGWCWDSANIPSESYLVDAVVGWGNVDGAYQGGTRNAGPSGSGIINYRCAAGYYGINPDVGSRSKSGCTACPSNGICDLGDNEIFDCKIGYYRSGNQCVRCPDIVSGTPGTTASETSWGASLDRNKLGIEKCYAPAVSYTDNVGIFEITQDIACYY